ncbi:MAG TPA: MBL fold metallo-hydrolase, partial [Trueperaceae bacterium]|nr:MBL fold metallo-hydrolase [Trueperaceae bacterium]
YPEIRYHEIDHVEGSLVLETDDLAVCATPGDHAVPVVGLRFRDKRGAGVLVCSGDTERSAAITELARGADLLVHEAAGGPPGHSSALDAAEVAREAGVGKLVLVHLPPGFDADASTIDEARARFSALEVGHDGGRIGF